MLTKVPSSDVKKGMFVSSLDRPWMDTPFMFQGFLIQEEEDIELLQKYCAFVQIDWTRSTLEPPIVSQKGKSLSAPNASFSKLTSDNVSQIPNATSSNTRPVDIPSTSGQESMFSEITGRILNFFKSNSKAAGASDNSKRQPRAIEDNATSNERPSFIPDTIQLSMYVNVRPIEEEITPAENAHSNAMDTLNNLAQDIISNKRISIEDTKIVTQDVVNSMVRNPDAMMWVTRLRIQDEITYGHGLQVAVYLVALGRHLGLPRDLLDSLCTIGLLLDIGKVKITKALLQKKGRLTSEEFEIIKSHVQHSIDILNETPGWHPDILQGIKQHHERENGSGYPAGLSGNEICLFGRMAAVADSFSALTNPRSYAEIVPAYEALQTLSIFNSELYQPSMVEQFIQAIGVFPVGSMVELSSGEVAVVISHSKVRRLKPRVLIISDSNKCKSSQPTSLDLLYQHQLSDNKELYIQRGLPMGAFGLDAREFYLN